MIAGELGLPVGRRLLEVQQPGERVGQAQLVLEPGDVHAGTDPAVALPVQADEDVRLGEVRPVQLLGRVRAGTQLEHDRRQPQRGDRPLHSRPLIGQLGQRGADEHAEALIGCADRPAACSGLTIERHAPILAHRAETPRRA